MHELYLATHLKRGKIILILITFQIWYKENHYVTEVWFLPSPDATTEDDGILFTTAFDGGKVLITLFIFLLHRATKGVLH